MSLLQKHAHWTPYQHSSLRYRCMFKTATLVYKLLHSGSPFYFQPFLSLSSCSYSTRCSHPDHQFLTVPPFRSSVFKSVKYFDHSFAFDAPKIWNELPHDVRHQLPPERSLKPVCKSISPIASPVTLCLLGVTWQCSRINVNCLALCSVAP